MSRCRSIIVVTSTEEVNISTEIDSDGATDISHPSGTVSTDVNRCVVDVSRDVESSSPAARASPDTQPVNTARSTVGTNTNCRLCRRCAHVIHLN